MFDLPLWQVSPAPPAPAAAQWLAEAVATFGLLSRSSAALARAAAARSPALVGLYITAAYWFTASTSFANPAVTVARAFSDTFAGIRPADVPAFVAAELAGAVLALAVAGWLIGARTGSPAGQPQSAASGG